MAKLYGKITIKFKDKQQVREKLLLIYAKGFIYKELE